MKALALIISSVVMCGYSRSHASVPEPPNVLFIVVDDLNDWIGAMGGNAQVKTPHLDRLFETGVLFTNAHCSQAVCHASRNSVLSGLHPSSSGWYGSTKAMRATYEEVMGEHRMMPEFFREQGYETLAVGKIYHQGVSDYGSRTKKFWDVTGPRQKIPERLLERGDGYGGKMFYPFPAGGSPLVQRYGEDALSGHSLCGGPLDREDMPGGRMYDELIADWAVDQLGQKRSKPFFMAVGFVRPHVPFTAPKEYFALYDQDKIEVPRVPADEMADIPLMGKAIAHGMLTMGDHFAVREIEANYWRDLVHAYLACVSFVDAQIGRVVKALEESDHAEETVIVLWSDHGQHLGEKHHWRKQALWEESTQVPLFFRVPEVKRTGARNASAVSLLDVYPTLVELCGLPVSPRLEGSSLVPLIKNPSKLRDLPVLSTWYYGNHAVRSNDWRYIRYRDGSEELYDHRTQAGEHVNLAEVAEFRSVKRELRDYLPEQAAFPAGTKKWKGDKLDERVRKWEEGDPIPEWLR